MSARRAENYGLIVKENKNPIPLKEVSIEAEISSCLLGLKSVLKYSNESSDPVEVLFRFPLEDSSAVVGLTAIIDGRRIKADVREKEEARAAYDDAIASGQSAALAEEKTGDIFSIALGNLPPSKEAEIHLQIVAELPIDAEENVRFSLPSVFKPRYTPSGSSDPLAPVSDAGSQVSSASVAGYNKFLLHIAQPDLVSTVTSPTHTISCSEREGRLEVSLGEQRPADKDMVILIKHKNPHQPGAVVEQGSDSAGEFMSQKALMVTFFPKFEHPEVSCEFIFLVDRSGSMSGNFIKSASETLILFMKSLPEDCRFNIIGFGSSYEQLFPGVSVPYSQSSLDKAVKHLTGLQANLGGTELRQPLDFIFSSQPEAGYSRQVFVLTDGAVSNTDACVRKVKENSNTARCFTFGIGSGASSALVEGLARAGKGSAEFVKEGERLQPKVIRSLKRALQPAVTDVHLEIKTDGKPQIIQCPETLPPIFSGEKLVAYALVKTDRLAGKAVLSGKLGSQPVRETVEFACVQGEKPPVLSTVHHLAAKTLIKDWERQGKNKSEVVKLSVEASVVSSHTAFIAVDEDNSEPIQGPLKTFNLQSEYFPMNIGYHACASPSYSPTSPGYGRGGVHGRAVQLYGGGGAVRHAKKKGGRTKQTARMSTGGKAPRKKTVSSGPPPPFLREQEEEESADLRDKDRRSRSRERKRRLRSRSRSRGGSDSDDECVARAPIETQLSQIIAAQKADGSWVLDASLARFAGKSLEAVKSGCPTECSGAVAVLWATLIVLEILSSQYSEDRDEWELVAAKADSLTKKQSLPQDTTLQQLKEAVKKLL